jgi:hypothetical protein
MGWVQCSNPDCGNKNWYADTVDLLKRFLPPGKSAGLFKCLSCGKDTGFVKKQFSDIQEGDGEFAPFWRGAIRLRKKNQRAVFQPFFYLVSWESDSKVSACYPTYYKDLRKRGGSLKTGHGPGGPPVMDLDWILEFVAELRRLGLIEE